MGAYNNGNNTYIREPANDTIYKINNTELEEHLVFSFGSKGIDLCETINSKSRKKAFFFGKIANFYSNETMQYLLMSYMQNNKKFFSIYDEKKQQYIFHKKYSNADMRNGTIIGITDDLTTYNIPFWGTYTNNNIIAGEVEAYNLSEEQQAQIQCGSDDNPIVLIGRLK